MQALGEGPSMVSGQSFKLALVKEFGKSAARREESPCLVVQPSKELLQILKWSYVAYLFLDLEAKDVQQRLVVEGLSAVKVTGMGEKRLLQIEGKRELEEVIRNHDVWWTTMSSKVVVWSSSTSLVVSSRVVWLQVYGIPMHVWDEPLFKELGNLFGVFVDFDEETISRNHLDFGRIKVSTTRMGLIDEQVRISVVGAVFCL